ncbi:unnamed protein product [Ectocarpus sp. 12 AP-2014]
MEVRSSKQDLKGCCRCSLTLLLLLFERLLGSLDDALGVVMARNVLPQLGRKHFSVAPSHAEGRRTSSLLRCTPSDQYISNGKSDVWIRHTIYVPAEYYPCAVQH